MTRPAPVRPAPARSLLRAAPGMLVIAAAWATLLVGRRICLVAQRLPPAVALVRAVYRWKDARRERRERAAQEGAARAGLA